MTVLELIRASLRKLGVIDSYNTPNNEIVADTLFALNLLIDEYQNESLISLIEEQSFSVASGTLSYTIGSGQTWDGNKPLKVLSALARDSGGYDHSLDIIGHSDYMKIRDKDLSGRPDRLFYLPGNSTGTVYLHPSPNDSYTLKMINQKALTQYSALTTIVDLPAGYKQLLIYGLAIEVAPEFETEPSSWILNKYHDIVRKVEDTNRKIPAKMTAPLFSMNGFYDIESDEVV